MVPTPPPQKKRRIATQVNDFTVLPLRCSPIPSYPLEPTTHYLYIRPNAPRIPTDSTPRELFLANMPIDATEKNLRLLFAEQLGGGRVEGVEFEEKRVGKGIKAPVAVVEGKGRKRKRRGGGDDDGGEGEGDEVGLLPETWDREVHRSGGTAVVRFVDATSASLALRAASKAAAKGKGVQWSPVPEDPSLGNQRYKAHHLLRYPDPSALQTSTDAYMSAFAAREAEATKALARRRAEPDEDGFVTVVRGGRNGPARPRLSPEHETDGGVGAKKKKKPHKGNVEEGFYRFQVRERMKREHGELARKFEEDSRRVEDMRRRRGSGRVRPE